MNLKLFLTKICWQERIAAELLKSEEKLMNSYYGKFFHKAVVLSLFRRDVIKWRKVQNEIILEKEKERVGKRRASESNDNDNFTSKRIISF